MNLSIDHVTVRAHQRVILADITVLLSERRIGIIGDNGSGKSTFVRLLNGLCVPDEGRVLVDGLDTRTHGADVRARVGFLFQNPDAQIVMPTVAEDVALGLKPLNLTPADRDLRVTDTLDRFAIGHLAERSVHMLSGGEKQLVAIAGVMITAPDVLVCDEPTTLLDRRNASNVMRILADLSCQVILVTHDLSQVSSYDRVLLFSYGRIAKDGTPGEAISAYEATLT